MLCEMAGRKRKLARRALSLTLRLDNRVSLSSAVSEARRCLSRSLLRLSLASLLCSESMLRRCAKSTFETFELQRPMYVRCKPHVPLLNLNRTHAPSEGDGRTIHDNIYKYIYKYIYIYTDSAGVDRTRRGSLRLAPIMYRTTVTFRGRMRTI